MKTCARWGLFFLWAASVAVAAIDRQELVMRHNPTVRKIDYDSPLTGPHPQGEISVSYVRENEGLVARISLPLGVTGSFVWKGRSLPVVGGEQTLRIPEGKAGRTAP